MMLSCHLILYNFQIERLSLMIQDLTDLRASNGLQNILSESVDIEYPNEFDDPQVFNDPKRILIGSMDFDKVLGDTSIFGGLVF